MVNSKKFLSSIANGVVTGILFMSFLTWGEATFSSILVYIVLVAVVSATIVQFARWGYRKVRRATKKRKKSKKPSTA